MSNLIFRLQFALGCFVVLLSSSCSAAGPSLPIPIATQSQFQSTTGTPLPAPTTPGPDVLPTPSYPPEWESFAIESPAVSLHYPPGWTVNPTTYHIELRSEVGYAWAELDWLSPDNPGLAGESMVAGGDLAQLSPQLEQALRDNGIFGDSVTFVTSGGGSCWRIEGHHDSFHDNVVVALVASEGRIMQFVGHQGDSSEDWDSLKTIYSQMIDSLSF